MQQNSATAWPSRAVLDWMRARLAASGGDPADIPEEAAEFWRLPHVMQRTGLSRASVYRLAKRGEFPRPLALTKRAPQESAAA